LAMLLFSVVLGNERKLGSKLFELL
jgi:hypothetical protein